VTRTEYKQKGKNESAAYNLQFLAHKYRQTDRFSNFLASVHIRFAFPFSLLSPSLIEQGLPFPISAAHSQAWLCATQDQEDNIIHVVHAWFGKILLFWFLCHSCCLELSLWVCELSIRYRYITVNIPLWFLFSLIWYCKVIVA